MGRKVWFPVVSGPLAPYAAGYESWLRWRAYSPSAAADRLCQFDQLSRWLGGEELGVDELTGEQAARFIAARRAAGRATWVAPQSVMLPLGYLRALGVWRRRRQRSWRARSRSCWRSTAVICWSSGDSRSTRCCGRMGRSRGCSGWARRPGRAWARAAFGGGCSLFFARECSTRSVSGARDLVCALRSFLRFLHLAGLSEAPLVWAVPSVADLRDRTLPRGLEPAAVKKLLASCDRRTLVGRRDYAILLLFSRLGLRAGEVAAIGLDDVDCGAGCCSFQARAAVMTCCRCRSMSARRWCRIFAVARGASAGRCSCG